MNIIGIIQARLGSTRLPGKVLLNLARKTVLEHVLERVERSKLIEDIVVATTIKKEDLEIVKLCSNIGISVYCGAENDVLDRYYQVAKLLQTRHIVRITADCPMIDPEIIDLTIQNYIHENADYSVNQNFPDGLDTEVFKFDVLKKAWKEASLSSEREHVTAYIYNHPEMFRIINYKSEIDYLEKRWTLDEPDDYEFFKIIFEEVFTKNPNFGMNDVLKFLKKNPEIENLNRHIIRNEGYLKSLKEEKVLNEREE